MKETMQVPSSETEHKKPEDYRSHILKRGKTKAKTWHVGFLDSVKAYFVLPHLKKAYENAVREYNELLEVCQDQEDEIFRLNRNNEYAEKNDRRHEIQKRLRRALLDYVRLQRKYRVKGEALKGVRKRIREAVKDGDERVMQVREDLQQEIVGLIGERKDALIQVREEADAKIDETNYRARETIAGLEKKYIDLQKQHHEVSEENLSLRERVKFNSLAGKVLWFACITSALALGFLAKKGYELMEERGTFDYLMDWSPYEDQSQ